MRLHHCLAVGLTASSALGQVSLQKLLLSGEQAPQMDPGTVVSYTRPLGIGAGGHFILTADTDYFGTELAVGYRGTSEGMDLWFRADGTFPSGISPDITIYGVQRVGRITPSGAAIGMFLLQGAGVQSFNNRAMYVMNADGSLQLALRDSQPAPGWGDSTGLEFGSPSYLGLYTFTIADDLRFFQPVLVEGETVLYGGPAHDPQIQLQVGGSAPGIPGATVTDLRITRGSETVPRVAGAGKVILRGTIAGAGIDASNNEVFWGGEIGALQVLHRKGDPAPGLHPGNRTTFTGELGWHNINAAGQGLFWSRLVTGMGDTTGANDGIVLTGAPGNLSVVVRKGDPVPGLPPGVIFGDVAFGHIGNGGVLGLMTTLSGPGIAASNYNDNAILTGQPGALTVRMREGEQVPGLPSNYVYGDPNLAPDRVFFNRVGAFVARVAIRDTSADETYIDSIIYWPPGTGDPTVVLRNDELIEVAPGDLRPFFRPVPVGLSDNGEILLHVRFDEDDEVTGSFIATVNSQPTVLCCRGTTCLAVPPGSCEGSELAEPCTGNTYAGCCYADFDRNGAVQVSDIFVYLSAWFAGSPYADVGGDGLTTPDVSDIFQFLSAWFAGCN